MKKEILKISVPRSKYLSELSGNLKRCSKEAEIYSNCVMKEGLNIAENQCGTQYKALQKCFGGKSNF